MMDIVRNGAILIIYLFIIFCLFLFLSTPFDEVMTGLDNVNGTSDSQVEAGVNEGRLVFNIMFSVLALVPIIWFVLWVFHREPDWRYK